MRKIINVFNISKTISIISNAVSYKRFIYSIVNLLLIFLSCLTLFLSSYLGIYPWANLKLLSLALSIVGTIISSAFLILFTIYQAVVLFSNFKAFGEKVLYATLTLCVCILSLVLIATSVYLVIGMY